MLYVILYEEYAGEGCQVYELESDLDRSLVEKIIEMRGHSLQFVCKDYERVNGSSIGIEDYLDINDFVDCDDLRYYLCDKGEGVLMSLPVKTVEKMLGVWKKRYKDKGWESLRNAVNFLKGEYFK